MYRTQSSRTFKSFTLTSQNKLSVNLSPVFLPDSPFQSDYSLSVWEIPDCGLRRLQMDGGATSPTDLTVEINWSESGTQRQNYAASCQRRWQEVQMRPDFHLTSAPQQHFLMAVTPREFCLTIRGVLKTAPAVTFQMFSKAWAQAQYLSEALLQFFSLFHSWSLQSL